MIKLNKKKIAFITGLLFYSSFANAQWATINVSDALYDYFQSMRDYAQNTNLQAIQSGQELQMAQAAQNVMNADVRNRMATTDAQIIQKDNELRPTVEQCIEASAQLGRSSVATASLGASYRSVPSGGLGGKGRNGGTAPSTNDLNTLEIDKVQENIRNDSDNRVMVLNNIKSLGTCSARYHTALCSGPGEYELKDIKVVSLLSNSSNKQAKSGMPIANNTIDDNGYKVGMAYIANSIGGMPKFPDKETLAKNPGYISTYNNIITKLNLAADTMEGVLSLRKTPTNVNPTYKDNWNNNSKDWSVVFPELVKPTMPSWIDYMEYNVKAAVFGTQTLQDEAAITDPIQIAQKTNQKIALNTYIQWENYKQQEKTNILLSNILIQLTSPMTKQTADKEYDSFASRATSNRN